MKHAKLFKENKQAQEAINKKNAEIQAKAKAERDRLAAEKAEKEEPKVVELDDEAYQKELKEAAERAGVKPPEETKEPAAEEEKKDEPEEEKGMKPNSGNGGQHENYHWEQTLSELTVYYYLPDGCTSKDLKVDMAIKKCKISIKGQVVLEKEWHKNIKQDDSLWCIETGKGGKRELQLQLQKLKDQNWWSCVWVGEEEINTQKVEPENSKLGDLDGETRGVVEKMMFDQRQKQQGLPSSDELEKREKLKAFMDAHPEMDFSKTKFS